MSLLSVGITFWVLCGLFRLAGVLFDVWGENARRNAVVQYHEDRIREAGGVWKVNARGESYFVKALPRV